ncbi:ABC-2 type transport system permease protein [Micromonospora citrea]|uniref:ABC-2 type transport system permease protein n=1 Tax=Micromonospora citrea TaxID=47855 RepID=A0A1C6VXE7_9ACTN|nr:ABC transporter permease [Micromonospora citrea]SCL70887.1 ABC-2 type transport system permease protein [Micromonospora citrea]
MSETTTTRTPATAPGDRATRPFWQTTALLRMELLALRRNWTATAMSVGSPLVIAILLVGGHAGQTVPGVRRVVSVTTLVMVFLVHHHLTTVYASRRQELVLKRLRAGLASDRVILFGTASSTILIFLAQFVVLACYAVVVLGLPPPANPLVIAVALLLGSAIMAAFSAALSAVTRTSEAAMLTTLPTVVIFLATPGAMLPLGALPESLERVLWFLPSGPFTEMMRVGWLADTDEGQALTLAETFVAVLPSLGVLLGWLTVSLLVARRYFRWEPRPS